MILSALFKRPPETIDFICRTWAKWCLWASEVTINIKGQEYLPDTPSVVVCNHQGMFDAFAVFMAFERLPVFVAKEELFKAPILGQILRAMGYISVDRKNREKAIQNINKGKKRLKELNKSIAFFPEGTRPRDGRLAKFKKGAFVFAIESGLPIVPIMIDGSYRIMPPKTKSLYPQELQVRILPAITTTGYSIEDRDRLTAETREKIAEALKSHTGALSLEHIMES